MAEKLDVALLAKEEDAPGVPRISGMSQISFPGLKVSSKQILEEDNKAWRMPQRIRTVNQMATYHAIAAALNFYITNIARTPYEFVGEADFTPEEKERVNFTKSVFEDMDTSFFNVLRNQLSYLKYGFAINEKVYKRRLKGKSKYNDGLIGIADLPVINQSTLSGWVFSEDGRKLLGIEQSTANLQYGARYTAVKSTINIPIEKLAILSSSPQNENPEGVSLLRGAYESWRKAVEIENQEIIGVARDLGGLLVLKAPAAYLDPNASESIKTAGDEMRKVLRNVSTGEQQGMLLPSDRDDNKGEMFSAELLSSAGSKNYDTTDILNRIDSRMLVAMAADVVNVGTGSTGSLALVEGKTELAEMSLEYRHREIEDLYNNNIIPQLYQMNGWDPTRAAKLKFGNISKFSLDSLSKYIQRVSATGGIEKDRQFYNLTRTSIGLDPFPDDEPVHEDETGQDTSRSGDGLASATGGLNGTSDKAPGKDQSSSNNENGE